MEDRFENPSRSIRNVIRFVFRYGDRNSSTKESLSQLKLRREYPMLVVPRGQERSSSRKQFVRHRAVHQRRPTPPLSPPSLPLSRGEGEPRFSFKGALVFRENTAERRSSRLNGKFKFRDRDLNGANVSTRPCPPVYGGGGAEDGKSGDGSIGDGPTRYLKFKMQRGLTGFCRKLSSSPSLERKKLFGFLSGRAPQSAVLIGSSQ